jgi:hypothetical protein
LSTNPILPLFSRVLATFSNCLRQTNIVLVLVVVELGGF